MKSYTLSYNADMYDSTCTVQYSCGGCENSRNCLFVLCSTFAEITVNGARRV